MRDKIKDMDYFNAFISEDSQRINRFQDLLDKGEVMEDRILPVKTRIHDLKLGLLIAEYSRGTELSKLKKMFLEILHEWEAVFRKDYYNKNLKIISLAVLFEVEKADMELIQSKILNFKISDWLLDYLIEADKTDMSKKLLFEDSFCNLKRVVYNENKVELLRNFLKNDWYCKDCGCYEAHKSKQNIYYGYWSFEAGAIAKILKLDDTKLKDVEFYPYDLVHYKDEL